MYSTPTWYSGHLINHWNELIELPSDTVLDSSFVHLVVAGGYDDRVQENVDYHKELVDIARKLAVSWIVLSAFELSGDCLR